MKKEKDMEYDPETGKPLDKRYLERGLPPYLKEALDDWKKAEKKLDAGEEYLGWDCDYDCLQSSINVAEVDREIDEEQAWYLREKYLGIKKSSAGCLSSLRPYEVIDRSKIVYLFLSI